MSKILKAELSYSIAELIVSGIFMGIPVLILLALSMTSGGPRLIAEASLVITMALSFIGFLIFGFNALRAESGKGSSRAAMHLLLPQTAGQVAWETTLCRTIVMTVPVAGFAAVLPFLMGRWTSSAILLDFFIATFAWQTLWAVQLNNRFWRSNGSRMRAVILGWDAILVFLYLVFPGMVNKIELPKAGSQHNSLLLPAIHPGAIHYFQWAATFATLFLVIWAFRKRDNFTVENCLDLHRLRRFLRFDRGRFGSRQRATELFIALESDHPRRNQHQAFECDAIGVDR